MKSMIAKTNTINLPVITGEYSMIPFDLNTLAGIPLQFLTTVAQMLSGIKHEGGKAFFTIHGKTLKASQTLRRGAPHTDGNYEPVKMGFGSGGGSGWKVGENGPSIDSELHKRQYNAINGGLILASNHSACLGWKGEFEGTPKVGGDCRHIALNDAFMLESNVVYYGNNHFIHESLAVDVDVHRVFARITMPENHNYHFITECV